MSEGSQRIPSAERPRGDFRPRLLRDDDPLFVGFLGVWSALGVLLAIATWRTAPVPPSVDHPPPALARLVPPRAVAPPVPTPEVRPAPEPTREAPPTRVAEGPSQREGEPPRTARTREELVRASPILVSLVGTKAKSERGLVEHLWSEAERRLDTDEALRQATGATPSASATTRTERAGGTDAEEVEIDRIGDGPGPVASVGVKVAVKAAVASGTGSVSASGDPDRIRETVARYARNLQYCYEKQLKAAPGLEGRLEVGWSVADGRVVGAPYVVTDTSGDPALVDCVTKKIRGWTFPSDVEGDLSWPFVFQQAR